MNHWVMDYETLKNCFVAVFEHYKNSERKVFVVHDLRNEFENFVDFIIKNKENKEWHISYNGLAFDSQITHYILDNYKLWQNLTGCEIAEIIHLYAAKCINKNDNKEFQDYAPFKMKIGQIDLFKMNHWDNPQKLSSLKWIQYSMDWDNILEMPIHHETIITTETEINTIIDYCVNDVLSTKEIYNQSQSQIKLRKDLSKKYDVNLFSASEPRISKEIFLYYLSQKLNIPKKDIKKMRSYRTTIKLSDLILNYIQFESKEFKSLLDKFKTIEVNADNLKGSFKYSMKYKNVTTHFGLGGVHAANKPGVYKSDKDYVIITSDVISFYPNLAIKNSWAPGHFPTKEFCDQYEWFFNERVKIPKKDIMNYVFKIVLNSTFGLSNEKDSFFYDPEFTMKVTVNGQLNLMMLYEMIMENIPEAQALMQNTDGIETKIPRIYYEKYMEICHKWEQITNLKLEHNEYQTLILSDVNNYIALNNYKEVDLYEWGKLKKEFPHYLFKVEDSKYMYAPCKLTGRFDFHNLALHKNKSTLIVRKAIYYYFIHNILPNDYLESNKNILDYCIGKKSKGQWKQVARFVKDNSYFEKEIQKINRYYISKSDHLESCKITKINKEDGREIQLEAGQWMQVLFNKIEIKPKWDLYKINQNYYFQLIESEIENIINYKSQQLKLF